MSTDLAVRGRNKVDTTTTAMENLDKFDPEHLDDEEYEPLAGGDLRAAEEAMAARDRAEGRGRQQVLGRKESDSDSEPEEEPEKGKKQATLFAFFKKAKKPASEEESATVAVATLKAEAEAKAMLHKVTKPSKCGGSGVEEGSLVWAKLPGYPWWPGLLCASHRGPVARQSEGVAEVHVLFLGEQTRAWVAQSMVRRWEQEVERSGGKDDPLWRKGVEEAEGAVGMTEEERLALMVADDEEDNEEDDDENEEDENDQRKPVQKRRRIMVCNDSDDSDDEEEKKQEDKETDEEEEEEYEVEQILDKRVEEGVTKYLIKWLGFEEKEDNTWEPVDNLDCGDKIEKFEESLGKRSLCVKDKIEDDELSAAAC